MSRTVSPSTGKPYRLALVCRVWRAPRAAIYRHQAAGPPEPQRRGPAGPMPDAALLAAIRAVLAGAEGPTGCEVMRLLVPHDDERGSNHGSHNQRRQMMRA